MDRISAAYESLATRRSADELGPAKVIQVCEPGRGLKAVVVIDNVARGPSIGGLRRPSMSAWRSALAPRAP